MKRMIPGLMISCALALGAGLASAEDAAPAADEILLLDGSKIIGKVVDARDGAVKVETGFAGTISIPLDQVVSVKSSAPAVMELTDETVIEGQPLLVEDQQLQVTDNSGNIREVELGELLLVNPEPWELGLGYKWTGLANLAMTLQRGNTDTDELDYKLESVWRSERDRYTLKFNGEQDETNNIKNADNWSALGKYDYFFDGPTYGGIKVSAESDKFADLDLRYYIGPYIGREFYTEPAFTMSAEIGLSYVNEDYIVADDNDYPGATWGIDMTSDYLGGDSRLYFNQLGIWDLQETSDVVINTTFGLAFPLLWNFEAAAEVKLEYDSGAPEDIEELDQTYSLRLGYTW
ncbi:DUF481 domain-containing protein [Mangrovimicrobium sediminis]|uniref:DUF481 domain-containing protein n=1 Tax=Mangrovimicrobium sediminis TaxID=2562682 RepID=A0A4Z0M8T7_9GAMM|nr:DUF481 domain-containing protein [Haliea sp. SAOS-164]TGD75798.1 DUF481 domain-containing protein [Haliea sp. SAOS-164]